MNNEFMMNEVSEFSNFFQNIPRIIPIEPQKEDTPKMDMSRNSLTKFIGAVISSGFSGIVKNAIA